MAGNPVEVSVRSDLGRIIADLEKIRSAAGETAEAMKTVGKEVDSSVNEQSRKTLTYLEEIGSMGRRISTRLKDDFKTLLSINALSEAFKLSEQFKGSIKESITLADTIRKLGRSFNISSGEFTKFQTNMVQGLGEIGLGSEVASETLKGLAGTPVRGQQNLIQYTQTAGQLASATNERGKEGEIARGISETLVARGQDPNDTGAMKEVAEDLRRAFNQTGRAPTEILGAMKTLFTGMSKDFRAYISTRGLVNLAAASQVAGPNSTKFLEEYLSKSPIARLAFEAQGGKGVVTNEGIDIEKFKKFSKDIMGRIGGDPQLAAQTLGLSEDAAQGFIRLAESLDQVKAAQEGIASATGSVTEQYKESRSLSEAFSANLNRVKKEFAKPLALGNEYLTKGLNKTSESGIGSTAVLAGGGILAALLAGFGKKGLLGSLGGLGGTVAKGAAAEALTGQKVQPVYVVNASEIASSNPIEQTGRIATALTGVTGFLKKAGLVGAAAYGGYKLGEEYVQPFISENTQETNKEGFKGDIMERFFFRLDKILGVTDYARNYEKDRKVIVELNKNDLKESKQPTRGASY